jgi:suppressor of ftsI
MEKGEVVTKNSRHVVYALALLFLVALLIGMRFAVSQKSGLILNAAPSPVSVKQDRVQLQNAPEVRAANHVATLTLHAVRDSNGRDAFLFQGRTVPPVIRVSPGDDINIEYKNDLPQKAGHDCDVPPCMHMTNLHFHGLTVSPRSPQDDVLTMMAAPGETLHYSVHIPRGHPTGLYWYHTHPHGESHRQVMDGMSGAIVIEGIESYVPELRKMKERVLVLRAQDVEHDPTVSTLKSTVQVEGGCGVEHEKLERIFTVNGSLRPAIEIAPGERQFWRIVNASADQYADIEIPGSTWEVVAMDGMPLAYHDPTHSVIHREHVLLPPAGRLEAIVSAPRSGMRSTLRTRCVDTGPDGDPNPGMVLADLVPGRSAPAVSQSSGPPNPVTHNAVSVAALEKTKPQFVVIFTEDKNGFYINDKKFSPDAEPMTRARVGSYQHWRILNQTRELHPMHIHQAHFLAYAVNGARVNDPDWLDTVNVPTGGSVDVIMDFSDPVIRGMSVFHCHLLNHEDKGMMAKILFE